MDIVELVRRDTDSKYSREHIKRTTRRLVRKITGDVVVGRIFDEAIEDIAARNESKVQPEGRPKDRPRPTEEPKAQEMLVGWDKLLVDPGSSAGSSMGKSLDRVRTGGGKMKVESEERSLVLEPGPGTPPETGTIQ